MPPFWFIGGLEIIALVLTAQIIVVVEEEEE